MKSVMGGGPKIGAERRPFPKPIREAIAALIEDARIDNRWLEWRADARYSTKMVLTLMTLGERQNRSRRLWGTWERSEAAGMEFSLKQVGFDVWGGRDWDLDWYDGERFALWYLPQGAAGDQVSAGGKGLLEVFGD